MDNLMFEAYLYFVNFHGASSMPDYTFNSVFQNDRRINYISTTTPDRARHYIYYGGRTTISNPYIILTIPETGPAHIQSLMMLYKRKIDRFDLVSDMLTLAVSHTDRDIHLTDNFIIQFESRIRAPLSSLLFLATGRTIYESALSVISEDDIVNIRERRKQCINQLWKDIVPEGSPLLTIVNENTPAKTVFQLILSNREHLRIYAREYHNIKGNKMMSIICEEWKYIRT
jgi:hypothetical protein